MPTHIPGGKEMQDLVLRALDELGGRAHRNAITDRVLKLGQFTRAQLAVPPPASNQGNFSNRITYQVSNALKLLKKQGKIDNIGNGKWIRLP